MRFECQALNYLKCRSIFGAQRIVISQRSQLKYLDRKMSYSLQTRRYLIYLEISGSQIGSALFAALT
jgi:hypothetical protein